MYFNQTISKYAVSGLATILATYLALGSSSITVLFPSEGLPCLFSPCLFNFPNTFQVPSSTKPLLDLATMLLVKPETQNHIWLNHRVKR